MDNLSRSYWRRSAFWFVLAMIFLRQQDRVLNAWQHSHNVPPFVWLAVPFLNYCFFAIAIFYFVKGYPAWKRGWDADYERYSRKRTSSQ